jgi:hypothetical protein
MAVETITHDLLLVSGPRAMDPSLQSILHQRFGDNEKFKAEDYLRDTDTHVFAASRTAARYTRIHRCTGDGCMPNSWCPISEYCKDWEWQSSEDPDKKTEL